MPSTTGIRRRLSPALLAGAPYRVGDRMAERYVVKDAVGLGPLGYVFRASDEQQGIDVAVKMIHPRFVQTAEEREAFTRAVEPARRFMQPSLARLHDLGVDQGWPYVTYSFLDGLTLRRMIDSRLAKGQTFSLEEVEPFLGQLAAALEAAHPVGAHADLKPENVVILPDMLRVVDWGLARGLPRMPFIQAQRQKSAHRYLAPELVAGAEADARADLYGLGVLVGEMLTGLTPDDDIPELRLTAPELPEAVEGFYRRALNERPEARFRSVRELYEEFVTLLAPEPRAGVVQVGQPAAPEVPETVVEDLEPLPESETAVEQPPVAAASVPEEQGSAPIPAAALPRFDGQAPETPRPSTREVVALDPPEWTGSPARSAEAPATVSGSERWQSLRLWDADEAGDHEPGPPAAAEATGPELPLGALLQASRSSALEHSDEDAERAVAGLTEVDQGSEAGDEPLLAEALGVDLVVDGDEPVPATLASPTPQPSAALPRVVAVPAPPTALVPPPPPAPTPGPLPVPSVREVAESKPWATEPRPPPFRREIPTLHPRATPVVAGRAEAPAVAARATLPPPPTVPPVLAPNSRVSTADAPASGAAPTPLSIVPEPSPTRQEKVVVPPPLEHAGHPATPGAGRGAGTWSPAELLAQVIWEIQAEERGEGLSLSTSWEPVPLDATQPISTEEVAARVGADARPPATTTTGSLAAVDEDLPALRHEAGRAGMRMALLTAAALILGMLGGWSARRLFPAPARPQIEHISEATSAVPLPAPRN